LDLIDVWFDSGSMPYAQWHYPFENQEKFSQNFPADYIAEGVDQTRGWFFTLHAIATLCFDSVAFRNVVSNGLVLDKNGQKMSKRLGNAVDPFDTLDKHGADPTRWYMIANANPWENLKFDMDGLEESKRKFFGTLYNTYSFFALYANIDGFNHKEAPVPLYERPEIDQWILSCLHTMIREVDLAYSEYEPTQAARNIENFVDEKLSNWYVRLCRRRFWKPSLNEDGSHSDDKISAYQTLYECLIAISKLMAPVAPFFAEWLYRNLNSVTRLENHESVHLALYPEFDPHKTDTDLEQRMDFAQRISSMVLSLRKREKLRVRQPLGRILIPVLDEEFIGQIDQVKSLILTEVNVKSLEYITDTSGLIHKKIKANFKTLGKRLGKDMKSAAELIASLDQDAIRSLERTNHFNLDIGGNIYPITLEDVEISSEDLPGWFVATDGKLTVALDTSLNEELLAEGIAREIVNRVQNLRKASDLQVTDRINLFLENHPDIIPAVHQFGDYIKNEVLADDIYYKDLSGMERIELTEGLEVAIEVSKVVS
jgi:isoleucyl-tRNA synthetase